jgi:hypothetical protein
MTSTTHDINKITFEYYMHLHENTEKYNLVKNGYNSSFTVQGKGKYWIDDWDEYYNKAIEHYNENGILNFNQLLSEHGPLTLDFDINYTKRLKNKRIYDVSYNKKKTLKNFMQYVLTDILNKKKYTDYEFYILEKPEPTIKNDKFKDGFHIHIDLDLTMEEKLEIYNKLCNRFDKWSVRKYYQGTTAEIIDHCVIDTNAWMTYLSVKPITEKALVKGYSKPYKITDLVLNSKDPNFTEKQLKKEELLLNHDNNIVEIMKLLNIRKYNNINYSKPKEEKPKQETNLLTNINISDKIIYNVENIDNDNLINPEFFNNILNIISTNDLSYEYSNWIKIMFICKRYGFIKEFIEFSKKDKNKERYNKEEIIKKWNLLKDYKNLNKKALSFGTLVMLSRAINEKETNKLIKEERKKEKEFNNIFNSFDDNSIVNYLLEDKEAEITEDYLNKRYDNLIERLKYKTEKQEEYTDFYGNKIIYETIYYKLSKTFIKMSIVSDALNLYNIKKKLNNPNENLPDFMK